MSEAGNLGWRRRFSDLGPRVRTGVIVGGGVLSILILAAFTCVGRWLAFLTALTAVTLAAFEYARFSSGGRVGRAALTASVVLSPLVIFGAYLAAIYRCDSLVPADATLVVGVRSGVLAACGALAAAFLSGRTDLERVALILRELPLATGLIGLGGAALVALTFAPGGAWIVAWLILVVSVNDSAAYFAGSRIGGPKLCPAISPNKTVSGSAVGLLCGTAIGTLTGPLSTAETFLEAAPVALAVVIGAQLGDLLKSYLKRLHGVKDSGTLLPGHGGVLDRCDGVLAGAMIVYVWVVGAW